MLNRDYILSLPAGREMDMLVNERLFGLTVRSHIKDYKLGTPVDRVDFLPSSFLPNAWEVVEQLNDGLYAFELGRPGDYFEPDRKWQARFGMTGFVEAETAPLAICRAALLTTIQGEES